MVQKVHMIWDPKWYRAAAAPYTPASRHGARIKYPECFAHVFVTIHVPRVPQNTFVGDGPMIFHRNPLKSHWYSLYNSVRMYSIIWSKFTVLLWFFGCDTYIIPPLKLDWLKKTPDLAFSDIAFKNLQRWASNFKKQKKIQQLEVRVPFPPLRFWP